MPPLEVLQGFSRLVFPMGCSDEQLRLALAPFTTTVRLSCMPWLVVTLTVPREPLSSVSWLAPTGVLLSVNCPLLSVVVRLLLPPLTRFTWTPGSGVWLSPSPDFMLTPPEPLTTVPLTRLT